VGSPDRMRSLIPLITDNDRKVVVLSAMSGTTNSLVEITELIYNSKINEASSKIEALREKYHKVVDELYATDPYKKTGHEFIDSHFGYINNFTFRAFSRIQEKVILAEGELISTALINQLLQERGIKSVLMPALNFMRIDKDGEPDYFYIEENLKREIRKCDSKSIIITQGFICRNAYGEIDNLKRGGSDYTASIIGAALKVVVLFYDEYKNQGYNFKDTMESLFGVFDETTVLWYLSLINFILIFGLTVGWIPGVGWIAVAVLMIITLVIISLILSVFI